MRAPPRSPKPSRQRPARAAENVGCDTRGDGNATWRRAASRAYDKQPAAFVMAFAQRSVHAPWRAAQDAPCFPSNTVQRARPPYGFARWRGRYSSRAASRAYGEHPAAFVMAFATTLRACAVAGCPGCTVRPSQHRATGEAALRTCVSTAMMPCSKGEIPLRFFAASAKADCNQVAHTSRPCRKSTTPPVWSRALVPLSRFIAVAGVMASFLEACCEHYR